MINVLEEAVRATYNELRTRNPEFCSCTQCQDDVITMSLNHAKPRWVVDNRPLGAAVTRAELASDQARASIAVIVFESMRKVGSNPYHPGNTPAGGMKRTT
jgi:competence protein ComFB